MRKFLRQLFTWKALVRLVFVVVLLATVLLIFITEENWRGRRAWAAYRSAAEARGEKLFLKDFIPADVPDAENYAAIPVIRELFAKFAMAPDGKESQDPFALPPMYWKIAPVSEEEKTDLVEWQKYFIEKKLITEKSGNPARDVLRGLERLEPALQQLRDASARPGCKFPGQWLDGGNAGFWAYVRLESGGRVFALRAAALLALGESAAAYREFRHGLRVYEALATEPSLFRGTLRAILLDELCSAIRDGLADARWTDAELRAIEKDFTSLNLLEEFKFAASSDRALSNLSFLQVASTGADRRSQDYLLFYRSSANATEKLKSRIFWTLYPSGWVFQNMVKRNELYDLLLKPYVSGTEANPLTFIPKGESQWQRLKSLGVYSGSKQFYYIFLRQASGDDHNQAGYLASHTMVLQARLACAMERFRHAKGAFPAELGELVPEFISSVPVDVCDGNPLRYRLNGNGSYDLWSIGPDRKDDGGKPDKPDSHGGYVFLPDFVWHMPIGRSPE